MRTKTYKLFLIVSTVVVLSMLIVPVAIAEEPEEANPYSPADLFQAVEDLKAATEAQSPPAGAKFVLLTNTGAPFWTAAKIGAARASAEIKVPIAFMAPTAAGKLPEQLSMLETLVNDGYNAITFSAIDRDAPQDIIQKAVDEGIVLLCTDSDATGSARQMYIGMSDYDAGRAAGEAALEIIDDGKVIALVRGAVDQGTLDRIAGLKDSLEDGALQLTEVLLDDSKPDIALRNAQTAMQAYPDLAGFITFHPYEAPMAGQAVTQAGKGGEIKIVALDAEPETQRLMDEGVIHAMIGQRVYFYGYLSGYVMYAMSILGQEETMTVLEPYLSDWPTLTSGDIEAGSEGMIHLNTGLDLITADSFDLYKAYLESIGTPSQ